MSVHDILEKLGRLGVTVEIKAGRLELAGPDDALTDDLIDIVRRHKPQIMRQMEGGNCASASSASSASSCASLHHMPGLWIDHDPQRGRVRTTCRVCGRLIGYRPMEPSSN